MQYQTFQPTILSDTTNQLQNGPRQTIKSQSQKSDHNMCNNNDNKISIPKQLEQYELLQEIEEQKQIIEGQNHFIQILRNSIESKLEIEGFQMILHQVLNMTREQKIDLFALITQLYQELSIQNTTNTQVENLQQLVENLNKQISCYAKELTELKVDKQYLIEQLDQQQNTTKDGDTILFKDAQISKLECELDHLKQQNQMFQQQNEKYQDEVQKLEKKFHKIYSNQKTEENEKEELIKELEQLKQTFYKSQVKEEHKLELNIALKDQELDYQNQKIKKLESQIKDLNELIEDQQKQIGTQKYQIENLQQEHQIQYDQLEIEMNQYRSEIHEQSIFSESLQQQLNISEQFITQIVNELSRVANINENDIFKIIQKVAETMQSFLQNELKFKQSEQEKSQLIFDLQHQFNDAQQTNVQLNEQLSLLTVQINQQQNELKIIEKAKRLFRSELTHQKQLNEQKNQEIKDLQLEFSKYDKKLKEHIEKTIEVEKENSSLKEQLNITQSQLSNARIQISNKKSLSFSQTSIQESKVKQYDYLALLQTFEKIKPLFNLESLDLVNEMLNIQNKLVRVEENIDSQLIQEELKLLQKIQLQQLNQSNLQTYLAKLLQENRRLKLQLDISQTSQNDQLQSQSQSQECLSYDQGRSQTRFHKQSMSVHQKPKIFN